MGVMVSLHEETARDPGPFTVEVGKALSEPAFSQLVAKTTEVPRGGEDAAEARPASRLAGGQGRGVRVPARVGSGVPAVCEPRSSASRGASLWPCARVTGSPLVDFPASCDCR